MNYSESVKNTWNNVVKLWKPPPVLTLSQWSDKNAYLSAESSHESGRWRTIPYQKGIMDEFTNPESEIVTVMKSARTGYTKMVNWDTAYHIEHDPCSQLIVQPTINDAEGYSKDEIATMFRDVSCLHGLVADPKSRNSNNTILKKTYPGGILHIIGANSPTGFRRITVKRVKFDETDGYPLSAGPEGDQIKLGTMRSDFFWDRKIILGSTPTVKGFSRIEKSFEASDQRYYYVPCPFCKKKQRLVFERIKWPKGEPGKAYYECEHCFKAIPHSKKRWMVENGEWIATNPFTGHAGFHIWAAYSYSPNAAWGKLAKEFLEANEDLKKNKDVEKLKTFHNTVLGLTWEERGERPDSDILMARRESYQIGTVPQGGVVLVAGVDTQDNRIAVQVKAYGRGQESWLVYYEEIYGDPDLPYVWEQLDYILEKDWRHVSGLFLKIRSMGIDTGGHKDEAVKNYCRKRAPIVFALKGASTKNKPILGKASLQDITFGGATIKKGVQLYLIGTDTAKATIFSRLSRKDPGPGTMHFPLGIEEDYFKQLTNEKLITTYKNGFPQKTWFSLGPHEVLDCEVYGLAALIKLGLHRRNWDDIEEAFNEAVKGVGQPVKKRKPKKPAKSNFMK